MAWEIQHEDRHVGLHQYFHVVGVAFFFFAKEEGAHILEALVFVQKG